MKTVHLTNGESAAQVLRRAGCEDVAVWCDIYHAGPVRAGLDPAEFRRERAQFHADCGFASFEASLAKLEAMDADLERALQANKCVAWFEDDLFDVLILLRLLHIWEARGRQETLHFNFYQNHNGQFKGVAQQKRKQLRWASVFPLNWPINPDFRRRAPRLWEAFTAPDPRGWDELWRRSFPAPEWLQSAMQRWLEEFPHAVSGRTRTQFEILRTLERGALEPYALFNACQSAERRPFLGDSWFWIELETLSAGADPLLLRADGQPFLAPRHDREPPRDWLQMPLEVTARARLIPADDWLEGRDFVMWRGGVQLSPGNLWRWDVFTRKLERSG